MNFHKVINYSSIKRYEMHTIEKKMLMFLFDENLNREKIIFENEIKIF